MKKNKRLKWSMPVGVALILLILFVAGRMHTIVEPDYHLRVIELDGGRRYGYEINRGKQTVVCQPFVPVLSGRRSFVNAEEAERVGNLVLERMKTGQDFSVTEEDLKRLGVGQR